ncbi:hypothetical protein PZA11_004543 [Diplocarpon coronariae]|uniref:Uncharacterized protein n=1 Tax=Diplocarpon coronariae TaxID=2795749 RepID=A0A218ZAT6_9HELO|nr:hypothetical protein JHW43_005323 [Diplocarpon mali]OWP04834.1 hypothetical protein B2J93_4116 [Marssonina coronariae]
MSTLFDDPDDGPASPSHGQSKILAATQLSPAQAIGDIVSRTNELILDHREWLANLPLRNQASTSLTPTRPSSSLITPPPSFNRRIAGPSPLPDPRGLPSDCSSFVASASAAASAQCVVSLGSASNIAAASIASLQAALSAANASLNSVKASAAQALGSASQQVQAAQESASVQSQSVLAVQSSANLAIASVRTSADQDIARVQSTASASILSANNALTAVQASASQAVASANIAASQARATATDAISQAQATISAIASQASATIAASRISVMDSTKFILGVTFSVLGSSLLTILVFYIIIRYRRSRLQRKQDELKTSIRRRRHASDESSGPSLSDFPFPANRTQWSSRVQSEERLSRNRPSARERAREREGTVHWPRDNERISIADKDRQTWMRGGDNASSLRSIETPISAARKSWAMGPAPRPRQRLSVFPFTDTNPPRVASSPSRRTWSPDKERDETVLSQSQTATLIATPGFLSGGLPTSAQSASVSNGNVSVMVRKNALTYDLEHPDHPPKFTTWLEESFRSVSPFPTLRNVPEQRAEAQRPNLVTRQSMLAAGRGVGSKPGGRGDSDGSRIGAAF